jgi:hypothetical protein
MRHAIRFTTSLILCSFCIVNSGCAQQPSTIHEGTQTGNSARTLESSPIQEGDDDMHCSTTQTQISKSAVGEFDWMGDGTGVYYQDSSNPDQWYVYSLADQSTQQTNPESLGLSPTSTAAVEEITGAVDTFRSQNGKEIVYTLKSGDSYQFYKIGKDQSAPIYLGDIQGGIRQVDWFTREDKLLIAIDWQGRLGAPEAYIYLVDIDQANVQIVIPHDANYSDIAYITKTPDEKAILFTSYDGRDRTLLRLNLGDNEVTRTRINAPRAFRWLAMGNRLFAISFSSETMNPSYQAVIVDFGKDTIDQHATLPSSLHEARISPKLNGLIYTDQTDNQLYLVTCVGIN